ncbi:hypothetical protein D3C78_1486720 [compost metagenome]
MLEIFPQARLDILKFFRQEWRVFVEQWQNVGLACIGCELIRYCVVFSAIKGTGLGVDCHDFRVSNHLEHFVEFLNRIYHHDFIIQLRNLVHQLAVIEGSGQVPRHITSSRHRFIVFLQRTKRQGGNVFKLVRLFFVCNLGWNRHTVKVLPLNAFVADVLRHEFAV